MSREDEHTPGLFSHETVPIPVYTPTENTTVHHRPSFSSTDDATPDADTGQNRL